MGVATQEVTVVGAARKQALASTGIVLDRLAREANAAKEGIEF